jgi:multiple sugar transport system permease protein
LAGPLASVMQRQGWSFLGTPNAALWSTLFLIVWRYAGFYMLLMLVGLQGIPADVYEAARIDGATRWQVFRRVTLPLLRPTLALTTVLCVTGSLLGFEQFYILTKGGPDNSTISVVQLIYTIAFQGQNDLGVAGALSVIVLVALVIINVLQLRAFRSEGS